MPTSGFNIPNVRDVAPASSTYSQKVQKMLSSGSSGGLGGLSQLMQLMRFQDMMLRREMGSTAKERAAYKEQQRMAQAQDSVFGDPAYQEGYHQIRGLSAQRAVDTLKQIKKDVIGKHAANFQVDANKLSDIMLGDLDRETQQRYKDVISSRSAWDELTHGVSRAFDAIAYGKETDSAKKRKMREDWLKEEEKRIAASPYLLDQEMRKAEGEGWFSRSSDKTGGWLANSAQMLGVAVPQILSQLVARSVGAMAGAARGGVRGGRIGAAIGAIAGGGAMGGTQANYDFAMRVQADPNLTPEQKEQAIKSGTLPSVAVGAVLGGIPLGARSAYTAMRPALAGRLAAQSVAEPAAKRAISNAVADQMTRKMLVEEANRSMLGNIANSLKWSVGEVVPTMTGATALSNRIYGGATNQNTPTLEGIDEAIGASLPLALTLGALGSRRSMSREQVKQLGWRDDGTIKPTMSQYKEQLSNRMKSADFDTEARQQFVSQFMKDYSAKENFDTLISDLDPAQKTVFSTLYNNEAQKNNSAKATTSSSERVMSAMEREQKARQTSKPESPESQAAREEAAKVQPESVETVEQMAERVYASRDTDPNAWTEFQKKYRDTAKQVEFINRNLSRMDPQVREFYSRLRADEASVTPDEVLQWLGTFRDNGALNRARNDLIKILNEGRIKKKGSFAGRAFTFDKFEYPELITDILNSIRSKEYGLHRATVTVDDIRAALVRRGIWQPGDAPRPASDVDASVPPESTATAQPTKEQMEQVNEWAKQQGAGHTKQDVGTNDAAGATPPATTASVTNLPVEAAAKESSSASPDGRGATLVRSDIADKVGGLSWPEVQNLGAHEALVSYIKWARLNPDAVGKNPGPDITGATVEPQEPSASTRVIKREDSRSSSNGKLKSGAGKEVIKPKKAASKKIAQKAPVSQPQPEPILNAQARPDIIQADTPVVPEALEIQQQKKTATKKLTKKKVVKAAEPAEVKTEDSNIVKSEVEQLDELVTKINKIKDDDIVKYVDKVVAKVYPDERQPSERVLSMRGNYNDVVQSAREDVLGAIFAVKQFGDNSTKLDKALVKGIPGLEKYAWPKDVISAVDSYRKKLNAKLKANSENAEDFEGVSLEDAFATLALNVKDWKSALKTIGVEKVEDTQQGTSITLAGKDSSGSFVRQFPTNTPREVFDAINFVEKMKDNYPLMTTANKLVNNLTETSETIQEQAMRAYFRASLGGDQLDNYAMMWEALSGLGFEPHKFEPAYLNGLTKKAAAYGGTIEDAFMREFFTKETMQKIIDNIPICIVRRK